MSARYDALICDTRAACVNVWAVFSKGGANYTPLNCTFVSVLKLTLEGTDWCQILCET